MVGAEITTPCPPAPQVVFQTLERRTVVASDDAQADSAASAPAENTTGNSFMVTA